MYAPVHILLFLDMPRRFGHAATDRQNAYLSSAQIEAAARNNPMEGAVAQIIDNGYATREEILQMYNDIWGMVVNSFNVAAKEDRVTSLTREDIINKNSRPMYISQDKKFPVQTVGKKDVMRKLMNLSYDEMLSNIAESVYIGEDVEHGGYYLVSEGLKKKFGLRVADFPPDETSLVGVGMGYSQAGLLPVVVSIYTI
jgi:hypothetical protein